MDVTQQENLFCQIKKVVKLINDFKEKGIVIEPDHLRRLDCLNEQLSEILGIELDMFWTENQITKRSIPEMSNPEPITEPIVNPGTDFEYVLNSGPILNVNRKTKLTTRSVTNMVEQVNVRTKRRRLCVDDICDPYIVKNYYCTLCSVFLNGRIQAKEHIQGKCHKDKLAVQK